MRWSGQELGFEAVQVSHSMYQRACLAQGRDPERSGIVTLGPGCAEGLLPFWNGPLGVADFSHSFTSVLEVVLGPLDSGCTIVTHSNPL